MSVLAALETFGGEFHNKIDTRFTPIKARDPAIQKTYRFSIWFLGVDA